MSEFGSNFLSSFSAPIDLNNPSGLSNMSGGVGMTSINNNALGLGDFTAASNPFLGISSSSAQSPGASPTPTSSTPDYFSALFQNIGSTLSKAIPAALNTGITNLANRVTQNPTLNAKQPQATTANPGVGLFGTGIPWWGFAIGGVAVIGAIYLIVRK